MINSRGYSRKNLISRRTLLSNGFLTGLALVTGNYLSASPGLEMTTLNKAGLKNGDKKVLDSPKNKLSEKTWIDHFDC